MPSILLCYKAFVMTLEFGIHYPTGAVIEIHFSSCKSNNGNYIENIYRWYQDKALARKHLENKILAARHPK